MRLIDADAIDYGWLVFAEEVRRQIKKAPTIEAEPVRHGRWVPTPECDSCWCSCCKKQYTGFFASWWNYCPNCGVKMDGGGDDG